MTARLRFAALLVAVMAVQSCQDPVSVVVVPADGATEVPLTTDITMTFNREISPGQFNQQGSYSLVGGGSSVAGSLSYSGNVVTFQPSAPLMPSTVYVATIEPESHNGSPWVGPTTWSFTTAPAWTTPFAVDPLGGECRELEIACNAAGAATVVWTQRDSSRLAVRSRRYVPGTGWLAAEDVDVLVNTTAPDAFRPRVAVDDDGTSFACFVVNGIVYATRRLPDAAEWEPQSRLSPNGTSAEIACDGAGGAWVAFSGNDVGTARERIVVARFTPSTGWPTSGTFIDDGVQLLDASRPSIASNASGRVVVGWRQLDQAFFSERTSTWAAMFDPETGWSAPEVVDDTTTLVAFVWSVAMDADGRAIAAMGYINETLGPQRFSNRFVPGSGWTGPVALEPAPSGLGGPPHVAMNSSGEALVSWTKVDGGNVHTVRFTPAAGWGPVEIATTEGSGEELTRSIVSDSGRAVVVWRGGDANALSGIFARRHEPDGQWRGIERVGPHLPAGYSSNRVDDPRACISASGRPLVSWRQFDGTEYRIFVSALE